MLCGSGKKNPLKSGEQRVGLTAEKASVQSGLATATHPRKSLHTPILPPTHPPLASTHIPPTYPDDSQGLRMFRGSGGWPGSSRKKPQIWRTNWTEPAPKSPACYGDMPSPGETAGNSLHSRRRAPHAPLRPARTPLLSAPQAGSRAPGVARGRGGGCCQTSPVAEAG